MSLRRLLLAAMLVAGSGCYDFKTRFETCRDAGLCVDTVQPAKLELVKEIPTFVPTEISKDQHDTLRLRNSGDEASGLIDVQVTDGGTDFSVSPTGCNGQKLDPHAECDVEVVFKPTVAGPRTGVVRVTADPGGDLSSNLSGVGVAMASITLDPTTYNFLSATVGNDTATATFTLVNLGPGASGPITWSTNPAASFPIEVATTTCDAMNGLAANGSCTIDVKFHAGSPPGPTMGSLDVTWAGGAHSVSSVLNGTSVAPSAIVIEPAQGGFNDVDTGTFKDFDFTVRAATAGATGTLSVVLSDAGSPAFSFAPGGTCEGRFGVTQTDTCIVKVRFTPTVFGAVSSGFEVTGTIGGTTPATMSGRGIDLVTLDVTVDAGTGVGLVRTSDGGIDCGGLCSGQFRRFQPIDLAAAPLQYNDFLGWGDACATAGLDASCVVTPSGPSTQVSAIFGRWYRLDVNIGNGRAVSSPPGLDCSGTCTAYFTPGTVVAIDITPDLFYGLISASGFPLVGNTATVPMTTNQSILIITSMIPRAFVTSRAVKPGDLYNLSPFPGGIDPFQHSVNNADAFCMAHAADAGMMGTFKAWISGKSGSALTISPAKPPARITGKGWQRTDGRLLGTSYQPIWYPLRLDERARDVGRVQVMTATNPLGGLAITNNSCTGYSRTDAGIVDYGYSTSTGPEWTYASLTSYSPATDCNTPMRLYCYEVMNGPPRPVPPRVPAGARLAFVTEQISEGNLNEAAADTECQYEATRAGLQGTFLSLRATTTASAASRFARDGGAWYRPDGIAAFEPDSRLTDLMFGANAPLSSFADGGSALFLPDGGLDLLADSEDKRRIYTGSTDPGLMAARLSENCANWSDNMGSTRTGVLSDSVLWFWDQQVLHPGTNECGRYFMLTAPKRTYCLQR